MHPIERLRYVARASGGDQRTLVRETAIALRGLRMEPAGLVVACRRIIERHPTSGPLWWFCSSLLTSTDPFEQAYPLASEVEHDLTPDHLYDFIADDATVCVVGWPDLIGDAVMRRGDVRVLAIDADDEGSAFVRRLQRADIDAEVVPPSGVAAAVVAADLVLIEAMAATPSEVLATPSSRAAASVAWCSEVPAVLVAGRGRRLPQEFFTAMALRLADRRVPWESEAELVPTALLSTIAGPTGFVDVLDDAAREEALAAECGAALELIRRSAM